MTTYAASDPELPVELRRERPADGARVDRLIDAAFGPGRFAKTAERLREGNAPRLDLSLDAWAGAELVGAVRLWPIFIGETPAIFLGPIAVEAPWRKHGFGGRMVNDACHVAGQAGERIVLLVGDPPFFGPLGFGQAPASVSLPGPVDPRRVLWRGLAPGALDDVGGRVRSPAQSNGFRSFRRRPSFSA